MITEESVLEIVKGRNGRVITPTEIVKDLGCVICDEMLVQVENALRTLVQSKRVVNIPACSLMYKINE